MSLSRNFYPTARAKYDKSPVTGMTVQQWNILHWTRQLELRPLRDKQRWQQIIEVDYDNRLDNWDIDNDKEITT